MRLGLIYQDAGEFDDLRRRGRLTVPSSEPAPENTYHVIERDAHATFLH